MWSDSLGIGRERRMSQRFCTSRRSFFGIFSRFRCTSQLKSLIFKMSTTSQCFFAVFLASIVMGILTILWFWLTFPPVKWGFSICLVSTESLLSSLLLFSSLRNFFACLSQCRYCLPARFETSSHVFRSFAIVFSLLLFSSLRNFFACLSQFRYCPPAGRSVSLLSPRRPLGLRIVPPKAARFAFVPPKGA